MSEFIHIFLTLLKSTSDIEGIPLCYRYERKCGLRGSNIPQRQLRNNHSWEPLSESQQIQSTKLVGEVSLN